MQNPAMVAKKLLVDDKIAAWFKQICLLGVRCKVSNRKTLSGETFFFLEKNLLSIFKFVLRMTYCFLPVADWPITNLLGMYCYFPVIRLVRTLSMKVAPVTVVAL